MNPKQFSGSYGDTIKGLAKEFGPAAIGYELAGHAIAGGGLPGLVAGRVLSHFSNMLGKKTTEAMAKKLISDDPSAMQEVIGVITQSPKAMNRLRQITQTASAVAPELGNYQTSRKGRAEGGKVYPAKAASRMEKAVTRAQKSIAQETKPLMSMPDHQIARALEIASTK
jgi:hypothetical protein